MYVKRVHIENYGAINSLDISFPFDGSTPKPVVIVGINGSGKSLVLSHIVNALISTQARPTADLVVSTVERAVAKSPRPEGVVTILHSYHGSQYTSNAYRKCLLRYGLRMSMGRVRTCADNASAASVFAQLKRELMHRCRFRTRQEAVERIIGTS